MHIKITDFGTAKIISGTEVNQKGIAIKNVYLFLLTLEIMLVVSGFGEK